MAATVTSCTKWTYSNQTYEVDTETYSDGHTLQYDRSILGPGVLGPNPYTEPVIQQVIRNVDPQNPNWKIALTQNLAQARFCTAHIATFSSKTGVPLTS